MNRALRTQFYDVLRVAFPCTVSSSSVRAFTQMIRPFLHRLEISSSSNLEVFSL